MADGHKKLACENIQKGTQHNLKPREKVFIFFRTHWSVSVNIWESIFALLKNLLVTLVKCTIKKLMNSVCMLRMWLCLSQPYLFSPPSQVWQQHSQLRGAGWRLSHAGSGGVRGGNQSPGDCDAQGVQAWQQRLWHCLGEAAGARGTVCKVQHPRLTCLLATEEGATTENCSQLFHHWMGWHR